MSDVVTVEAKAVSETSAPEYTEDNIRPIAGLLGLDTHKLSDTDSKALNDIYTFMRGDATEMTELELLHKVRELEQRLGMTSLGERRVDKLYRYVKLQSQIDNLSKARDREIR